jgi:nucleoside-diphosphate-sugar epimerase
MNIVLTGAAGYLGRTLRAGLRQAGWTMQGLDRRDEPEADIMGLDLLDGEAVDAWFAAHRPDTVIHFANHSHARAAETRVVFAENCAMTWHVLEAAENHGTRRILYASSVQAFSGGPVDPGTGQRNLPHFAIPVDGTEPPMAGNAYGLSKVAGEQGLAMWVHRTGGAGIALRLPRVVVQEGWAPPDWIRQRSWDCPHGEMCAWLPSDGLVALVDALLRGELPGYRSYFPAMPWLAEWPSLASLVQCSHAGLRLRETSVVPAEPFDLSRLTADCGWRPVVVA